MKTLVLAAGIVAGIAVGAPARAQTEPKIAIIVNDLTSPYWQSVLAGAHKAGQDFRVDVVAFGARSETGINGKIGVFNQAVASKPAAIVIAAAQSDALLPAIDEAAKTIKIIGIEFAADNQAMTSLVATDNVKAGRVAAETLAAAITKTYGDTEGNLVLITSMPGIRSFDERAKGFKEVIAAKYRALDIVADRIADGNATTVLQMMRKLIADTADLRGVFVSDPVMTSAVAQAVAENRSGDKINVIGVGSDEKLLKLLQEDVIAGLVVEDPFRMGYDGIKTALAAAKGEQVAANVDTGVTVVTKANSGSARSKELLAPRTK
ncbi:MAG TPA: substrate-binding domain-containing protein [Xanthobacteraceae bacterium]|jgi:ribose transport system substrate-binding protein